MSKSSPATYIAVGLAASLCAFAIPSTPRAAASGTERGSSHRSQAAAAVTYSGKPSEVLLQAFAWRSKWNGQHGAWYDGIAGQAVEIGQYFTSVWFPPPGKTIRYDLDEGGDPSSACGYMPLDYRDYGSFQQWVQESGGAWYQHAGTETLYGSTQELKNAITSLHSRNVKVLADVVINHRAARQQNWDGEWCSWKDYTGQVASGYMTWGHAALDRNPLQILNPDGGSGGTEGSWTYGGRTYSCEAAGYAADIAHWNSTTRSDIKSYLNDLCDYLGFDGFRYDMIKGFSPAYLGEYNDAVTNASKPSLSVGEWYEYGNRQALADAVNKSGNKTTVFDFATKGILTMAVKNYDFSGLRDAQGKPAGGIGWWPDAMVTFVDNHDTGESVGGGQKHNPIEGSFGNYWEGRRHLAYAYVLTHPGIPSVYWYHWADCGAGLKGEIKKMISARKQEKVVKTSVITIDRAEQNLYAAYIGSANNRLAMKIGSKSWSPSGTGWSLATSGTDYAIWTKDGYRGDVVDRMCKAR